MRYHIENEAKDAGIVSDALKEKRQKEAYPVILQFEKWMNAMARKASQNSRIGKAIKYTFPLLPRLGRYVNDGRFCIDNNLVENAIRPLALGRKNYLFCGNHDAAVRAAIVYSFIDTCKALDVDPRLWLEDVLLRIPGNEDNRAALRNLLPDRWKSNLHQLGPSGSNFVQLCPSWENLKSIVQVVFKRMSGGLPMARH